jgi:hypothetical protein
VFGLIDLAHWGKPEMILEQGARLAIWQFLRQESRLIWLWAVVTELKKKTYRKQ